MSSPTTQLGGRERKKLATRRALRKATIDLALERRLADVSVEEIAARAGVSTRTFFNYFDTKEDAALLELPTITEEELAELAESPSPEGLWRDLRRLFVADTERAAHDVADLQRHMLLAERNPALVARQMARFTRFESMLADAVVQRLGDVPSVRMRAELIAGLCVTASRVALSHLARDRGDRPPRAHVEAAFDLLSEVLVPGET
jgi:AcrR family transcriptional regulator